MNAVVKFDPSVPAFLQNAAFLQFNQKAAAGLSMGAPPRLSFKGSRFRLVSGDGTETPVTENNGVAIDVVVVDASANVSKFYYPNAYVEGGEDQTPVCFSDNGVGPSNRATEPQHLTCAGCPKNAWGSKVTPQGTQIKACSDVKKLAIIPVSNIDGPAYMLGIPAASLKTWTAAVAQVSQRGIPIPALVFRISFDASVAYPKLTFSPTRYITEAEAGALQDLFGSEEVAELVGSKDVPITAMPAGAQAVQAPAQQMATGSAQQATQQIFTPPAQQPAPAFIGTPTTAAAPAPAAAAAPRRRGRPPANPAPAAAAAPVAAAPAPAQVFTPAAPPTGAAATPVTAPPPGGDVGALLDQIMGA